MPESVNNKIFFYEIGKWLIIASILWSPIAGIPDLIDSFAGVYLIHRKIEYFWPRAIREGLIFILYIYFVFFLLKNKYKYDIDFGIFLAILLLTICFMFIAIVYTIFVLLLPLIMVLLALKVFFYLPFFILFYLYFYKYPIAIPAISRALNIILMVQLIAGIIEIIYMPPLYGASFFGTNLPQGTFAFYLIYATYLNIMLYAHLFIKNFKTPIFLVFLTIIMIMMSGSRTNIIILFFLIFIYVFIKLKKMEWRIILSSIGPIIGILVIFILPFLSGRDVGALTEDPRVKIYNLYFISRDLSFFQILFGSGVGLASGTTGNIFGKGAFHNQFYPDGMHLWTIAEYGFIGLSLFYATFIVFSLKYYGYVSIILFIIIMLSGFGTNILESYPSNFIIPILLGIHIVGLKQENNNENN